MSQFMPVSADIASFSPLRPNERSLAFKLGAIVLGSVFLAISSYIAVPMVPVPITMQTFAITLIGALYGWRLAAITVVVWLLAGALGMPVLAHGSSGPIHFIGPTSGYLLSFPMIAGVMGFLAERGWNGQRPLLALIGALLANIICLFLGGGRLILLIGFEKAVLVGVFPFLIGCLLKSCLTAATLAGLNRLWPAQARL